MGESPSLKQCEVAPECVVQRSGRLFFLVVEEVVKHGPRFLLKCLDRLFDGEHGFRAVKCLPSRQINEVFSFLEEVQHLCVLLLLVLVLLHDGLARYVHSC